MPEPETTADLPACPEDIAKWVQAGRPILAAKLLRKRFTLSRADARKIINAEKERANAAP